MVDNWFELQSLSLKKLPEKVQEQKLIELQDYYECLVVLFEKFKPKSLNSWKTEIDKIFDESTTTRKIIDLYTIHSGKGGEGHYTFILYPENMPIKFEKQSQEEKLKTIEDHQQKQSATQDQMQLMLGAIAQKLGVGDPGNSLPQGLQARPKPRASPPNTNSGTAAPPTRIRKLEDFITNNQSMTSIMPSLKSNYGICLRGK